MLMYRYGEYIFALIEDPFGSVAMVNVDIYYRNALEFEIINGPLRGYRNVIEHFSIRTRM